MNDERLSPEERYLRLNANLDYMAGRLADCLRHCMRAVAAATGDSALARQRAIADFVLLVQLMERSEGVRMGDIFEAAIKEFREVDDDNFATVRAARSGLQFLVELSCSDGFARGRASQRERDFLAAIERALE